MDDKVSDQVKALMDAFGLDRREAERIAALDDGSLKGDVVAVRRKRKETT